MNKFLSVRSIIMLYLMVTLTIFFIWRSAGRNSITGDEPHYLVIASGIGNHGTLEQIVPYREEFKARVIYKSGLAAPDENPSPQNTHTILGPHGLFNIHNIGLPLVLALPLLLSKLANDMLGALVDVVLCAKLFMIAVESIAIVLAWKISGAFSNNLSNRFYSTLGTSIALPLLPAANQIYPDILAGIITLSGIYWFMTIHQRRLLVIEGVWAAVIAFLPWLQIKFFATSFLLIIVLLLKILFSLKETNRVLLISTISIISWLLLGAYNDYAFGKFSGPYQSGALELSRTSLMVLLGLFLDQNQGFLFQNPIMFIGVFAIGMLYKCDKYLTLLCIFSFLSLIVPNALHTNWYGAVSFSGRFAWSATIVFFMPTLFGLTRLASINNTYFKICIGVAFILQIYFFLQYTFNHVNLYNRMTSFSLADSSLSLSNYSIYFSGIYQWLPALYNINWVYEYAPNYAWLFFTVLIFALGFSTSTNGINKLIPNCFETKKTFWQIDFMLLVVALLAILLSGFITRKADFASGLTSQDANIESTIGVQKNIYRSFIGKDLPSQIGRVRDDCRIASQGLDNAGLISYGPYVSLEKGKYQAVIKISSIAPADQIVGWWDMFDAVSNKQLRSYYLYGTVGKDKILTMSFEVNQKTHNHVFEFRSYWSGIFELKIYGIEVKKL